MSPISLQQLYEQYGRLRAQLQHRQLSHQQFVDAVHQLQAQDQAGNWWTIDPQTGQYLTYTANGWVPATPAATPAASQPGTMFGWKQTHSPSAARSQPAEMWSSVPMPAM